MTTAQDVVRMLLRAAEHRLRRAESRLALVEARVEARRRLGGAARADLADLGALQVEVSGMKVAIAFYGALLDDPQSSAADVPPTTAEVPP